MWLRLAIAVSLLAPVASSAAEAPAVTRDARPLATLLDEGGRVVAASGEFVWVESQSETYMCVIEISDRFRHALRYRNVRELLAAWPKSLCFNAGSFE